MNNFIEFEPYKPLNIVAPATFDKNEIWRKLQQASIRLEILNDSLAGLSTCDIADQLNKVQQIINDSISYINAHD